MQVSNALSVLAAMQGDLETMLLYSEVIVRKSARWRVPLSALALKVMRNEVVVPVLSVPVSLPTRVSTCPAWRSYLNAVTVLTYWHGYDVMVGFNGVLAEVTAGEVLGLTAEESKTTPLARVSHVVGDVLEWWRQPAARHVLSTVPEADLWSAFVQRSQGDSSWEARSPPVLVQLMSGELPELRRPTTVELRLGDISAFVHSLKLTLTRYGCLYTPDSVPDHFMTRAFTVSPGCQMLREYMQSAEGSAAYVRLHAADPGITGFFVRLFARISLNLYLLRDALLLSLEPMFSGYGEGFFALWGASRPVKHALKKSAPTVFEWMAQTDPWTVFGTSIAALLAVLRVAVRLSSAFSTAASISTVPLAQDNLTITGPSATPDASATGAAPAPGANRKGKKSTKGRNKAPKSKTPRSTTSIPPAADFQPPIAEAPPRVAAAQPPAQPARPTLPQDTAGASASSQSQAEQPVVYDPVAQRLVSSWPQGPVSSSIRATSCKLPQVRPPASPRTVELLRTAMLPAPAGDLSPSLARALVAGLPRMLFMPSSALLRHTATIEAGAAAAAAVKLPTVEVEIKDHASKGKADSVHMASSPRQSSGEVAGEFIRTSAALSAGGHDTQGAHVTEPSHSPSHSTRNDSGSGLMHHHAHSSAELIPQVGAVSVGSTACTAGAAVRAHAAAEASAVASVISSLSSGSSAAVSSAGGTDKCSTGGKGEGSDRLQVLRKEECGQVPELFLCPISREVMENPVLASDGHVYERSQIESWLQEHDTSPMTNIAMRPEVAPVLSLRSEIQDFKQRYPHLL